jgi:hypothetical protein
MDTHRGSNRSRVIGAMIKNHKYADRFAAKAGMTRGLDNRINTTFDITRFVMRRDNDGKHPFYPFLASVCNRNALM